MALPPVHRIDHEIVFIHELDSAWDHDRIQYELDVIAGKRQAEQGRPVPEGGRDDHPWVRFVSGQSRGDIRTAEEYLLHRDGPDGPVRFHFQRLSLRAWATVKALQDQGLMFEARLQALKYGLTGVDGSLTLEFDGGSKPKKKKNKGDALSERDVKKLRESVGDEVLEALGTLAITFSRELTEDEKKIA